MKILMALAFATLFCGPYAYAASCSDKTLRCMENKGAGKEAGKVQMGQCWFYLPPGCDDCKHTDYGKYAKECNGSFSSKCEDNCYACYPADGSSGSGELTCYDSDGKAHNVVK